MQAIQLMVMQVLCVVVSVWLTQLLTPLVAELRPMTLFGSGLWPLVLNRGQHKAPGSEYYDLNQMGDPYLEGRWGNPFWYAAKIQLFSAAVLGSIAPLLPLGHNPVGLAGMVLLIPLFAHMVVIDFTESRLPHGLTMLSSIIGLATVLGAGIIEPEHLATSILGGGLVMAVYGFLWFINKKGLGYGDFRLSFCIGLILGWNGWYTLLYGWAAAWLVQGLVSATMLVMAKVKTRKALLPLGPAIIGATFLVPLLFVDVHAV